MAGEPVGEVDADPVAAEAAVGERRAARVGFGRRASRRPALGSAGIGWPVRTASKRRAPMLRGGLEQRRQEDVERAEADAQPVQRLAVGLLEMRDGAEHRLARKHAAGVGEHCRERAHAGRARRIGRRRGEHLRAAADAGRSARRASARAARAARRGSAPTGGRARGRCAAPARAASGRARGGRGHGPPQATARPPPSSTISAKVSSGASTSALARRSSSSPRRRSAAASSRRLSASRADGSTRNSKPVRWPIGSGPTLTSPSAATVTGKRVGAARADVAHQHRGAAVDEALGQPLVERVAEAAPRPRACARPISPAPSASRRGGRYRPSCGCRRGGRRAPRCRRSYCRAGRPRRRTIRAGCGRLRRCS